MDKTYSYLSGNVNLTCEAVAEPHANFTWIKANKVIQPSDTVRIHSGQHSSVLQVGGPLSPSLFRCNRTDGFLSGVSYVVQKRQNNGQIHSRFLTTLTKKELQHLKIS